MSKEELMLNYKTFEKNGEMKRFYDSEHKIFAANDRDINALYAKYGKENIKVLQADVKTLYEPCSSCKKQFLIRNDIYQMKNLKIKATKFGDSGYVLNNNDFLKIIKKI